MADRNTLPLRLAKRCAPMNERGCIEWQGPLLNSGYGYIRLSGPSFKKVLAHRAAWINEHGEIPDGLFVLHNCDNKLCVNVKHLRLGNQSDNMRDFNERDSRSWRQTHRSHHWEKLSIDKIPEVFKLRGEGCTQQEIADKFGVSRPLISLLLNGKLRRVDRSATCQPT